VKGDPTMTFDAHDRSLDLLRALVPLLARLAVLDGELASQCRRAAQSVALNIAEANRRTLRDRRNRFRIALGSAAEVSSCLQVAVALAYLDEAAVAPSLELADRVRAMTYRLAR
jgi:four helix bundle protein